MSAGFRFKALPGRARVVVALLAAVGAFFVLHRLQFGPGPLRLGATADEAWTYFHTNTLSSSSIGLIPVSSRSQHSAYARSIQCETRFFYGSLQKRFAIRTTVYELDTNRLIAHVRIHWKFNWPVPAASPSNWPSWAAYPSNLSGYPPNWYGSAGYSSNWPGLPSIHLRGQP